MCCLIRIYQSTLEYGNICLKYPGKFTYLLRVNVLLIRERLHRKCDLFFFLLKNDPREFTTVPLLRRRYLITASHSTSVPAKSRFAPDHKRTFRPLSPYIIMVIIGRFSWESRGTRASNSRKQIDDNQSSRINILICVYHLARRDRCPAAYITSRPARPVCCSPSRPSHVRTQ